MGRLDRRALFTSGAAAALLAASGLSLAAAPRAGGRLRLALAGSGSLDRLLRCALFETLTEVAPDGVLRGELATGWSSDDEARSWIIDLNERALFHDGSPVTSADVAASLTGHGFDVEADGAHRVRFRLATGNPDLPYLLSDPALVITPRGVAGQVGSGPYRVSNLRRDRHFSLVHVAGHARGWVEQVQALVIPDNTVRAEALRDGHVDVAELPDPEGLRGRGTFLYHPSEDDMALAAHPTVGLPRIVSARGPLDDGRLVQRWWRI